jgi:hypothetical protein
MAARHVDIVSNEPLAGKPRLLARIVLNGGPGLDMYMEPGRTNETQMWRYLRSRVQIDPDRRPGEFLEALTVAIDSTYIGASEIHDEANCPFCSSAMDTEAVTAQPLAGPLPA